MQAWWAVAEENRLHDSMLLDALVRLARDDSYPGMRDLGTVVREYTGLTISKDDPYRLRYGEIIGRDWDRLEVGFFEYAVKDAIVTRLAYQVILERARAIVDRFLAGSPDIAADAVAKYGILTEAVQVKKAIGSSLVGTYLLAPVLGTLVQGPGTCEARPVLLPIPR